MKFLKTKFQVSKDLLIFLLSYQPSDKGGSILAKAHCLQNQKWSPGGSKMANGLERGLTSRFWGLLLNKFLDWSGASMRNINDREKIKRKEKQAGAHKIVDYHQILLINSVHKPACMRHKSACKYLFKYVQIYYACARIFTKFF